MSFQLVQDKLVKVLAEVCSMQLYCLRLGRLIEEGKLTDTIAALAKINHARKARQVISEAQDLLIVRLVNGRILARCIPRARLQVIAGGGHLFLLERPAEMARLIATFLRSEPPPS